MRTLILLLCAEAALAAVRVPFSINVDGTYLPTNAYVEFPYEAIDQTASTWKPPEQDKASIAFAALVMGINDGRTAQVDRLYKPAEKQARSGIEMPTLTTRQFAESYRQAFAPFSSIRVLGRVAIGTDYLYVWEGHTAKGFIIRGFRSEETTGDIRFSPVSSQQPYEAFLLNVLGHAPVEQWQMNVPTSKIGETVMPISQRHEAFLLFGGTQSEALATGAKASAQAVFAQMVSVAQAGKFTEMGDLMSRQSASRFEKWVDSVPVAQQAAFQKLLGKNRRILKVAALGSVDLVFWIFDDTPQPHVEDLQYAYLHNGPQGAKVVNYFFESLVDDALRGNTDVAAWCGVFPAVKEATPPVGNQ